MKKLTLEELHCIKNALNRNPYPPGSTAEMGHEQYEKYIADTALRMTVLGKIRKQINKWEAVEHDRQL